MRGGGGEIRKIEEKWKYIGEHLGNDLFLSTSK